MQDARGVRIQHRVRGHLLAGRHADDAALAVRVLHATHESNDLLLRRRAGLLARWRRLVGSRRSIIRLHRIRIHRRAPPARGGGKRRNYLSPTPPRAAAGGSPGPPGPRLPRNCPPPPPPGRTPPAPPPP